MHPDKLYVIVRADLSHGQQATQATHAAFDFSVSYPETVRGWHDDSNYLVLLGAADQQELLALVDRAWDRGLRYTVFADEDRAEGDRTTAVVIEPGPATSRLCANLPLALKEKAMA